MGSAATGLTAGVEAPKPKLAKHQLGRTKLRVSRISLGGRSRGVLKPAMQAGINMVHTSTQYERGKSIRRMGETFAKSPGMRDKLVLCIKGKLRDLERELDEMLGILRTNHADVYLPMLTEADERRLEELMTLEDSLQKKGKIRFKGFVCHSKLNDVFEMILAKAPGYFDAALLATGMIVAARHGAGGHVGRYVRNLAKLRKQGLGVISMKSKSGAAMAKGGKVFQAHCKALLAGGVDTILHTFGNLQQVDLIEKLDLSETAMAPWERRLADGFHGSWSQACLMCGRCAQRCPQGTPVDDLMRIRMHHDEYQDRDYAQDAYDDLNGDLVDLASRCGDCTTCTDACPVGLASRDKVRYVTSLLS